MSESAAAGQPPAGLVRGLGHIPAQGLRPMSAQSRARGFGPSHAPGCRSRGAVLDAGGLVWLRPPGAAR
jgi:hypothetical protein